MLFVVLDHTWGRAATARRSGLRDEGSCSSGGGVGCSRRPVALVVLSGRFGLFEACINSRCEGWIDPCRLEPVPHGLEGELRGVSDRTSAWVVIEIDEDLLARRQARGEPPRPVVELSDRIARRKSARSAMEAYIGKGAVCHRGVVRSAESARQSAASCSASKASTSSVNHDWCRSSTASRTSRGNAESVCRKAGKSI